MARWASNNNQKLNSRAMKYENDMWVGTLLCQKSGIEVIQNCDLPPPSKVCFGSDMTALSPTGREEEKNDLDFYGEGENEKLGILKALRLSQTRAREAEKKAADLVKEKDRICNALLRESMQVLAYRQWVRLLEVQVSKLQSEIKQQEDKWRSSSPDMLKERIRESEDREDRFCWFATLGICLGVAFGFTYLI